jgi:trimethylamine--corrinoid protein Co-methyltransferase
MTDTDGNGLRLQAGFLGDDDKQAIYDAALEIAETVGMRVHQKEALELLRAAGAEVVGDDLVKLPRRLVERARSTAPSVVPVFDRNGEPAMRLGGRRSYFGTGSDLMNIYDLETGERRLSGLDDVTRAANLCDGLPNIDFVMSCAYPNDVEDPHQAYVAEFRAMVLGTTKPMVVTAEGVDDLEVMWNIAAAVRGGAEALAEKPYFVMYGQPSSPLEHPRDSLDKLLFCADKGIPAIYSPAPLAGATAPITVAGHIAQGTAESLFGLVMHQLRKPGAPFLFGIGPAVLDMATAQSSYNAPEYLMTYLGAIEMARWLDLPNWGYGGTSDSQLVDAQAGMEAGELTLLAMMAGSNLNHDVGYLDYGLTGALELVVIVDEFVAMNRRLLGGITVDRETLGLDVIAATGPGGDFLSTKHTAKHMRAAQWRPTIMNRKGYERWTESDSPDLREQARLKAQRLLATHEAAPLAADVAAKIDALVEGFAPAGRQG